MLVLKLGYYYQRNGKVVKVIARNRKHARFPIVVMYDTGHGYEKVSFRDPEGHFDTHHRCHPFDLVKRDLRDAI